MQTQRGRQLGNKGEIYLSIYQNAGNECLVTKGNKGESKKTHKCKKTKNKPESDGEQKPDGEQMQD